MVQNTYLHTRPNRINMRSHVYKRDELTYRYTGEGATDAGGPYRDTLSTLCNELQSARVPLFIPTPNAREGVGQNTDQWMPNPSQTSAEALAQYRFVGYAFVHSFYSAMLIV